MYLLLIFIAVPILEIAVFIQVGQIIGLWPTIACIILTAVAGTALLRRQGLAVLQKAQGALADNRLPVDSVLHGAFLLVSGILLLTPGFFTDAVGFALLVPPVRTLVGHFIWSRLKDNVQVYSARPDGSTTRHGPGGPTVIDGEAVEVDDTETRGRPKSANGANETDTDANAPPRIDSPWRGDREQ